MKKSRPFKHTSFLQALKIACIGLGTAFTRESNLRWQVAAFVVTFLLAIFLGLSTSHIILVVIISVIVITLELINSAFEVLADIVHPTFHEGIKYAKDVMAAAVLVASIGAIIVGLWVFVPAVLTVLG